MTKWFEKRWKNKMPEAYRDWTAEALSEQVEGVLDKMKNMTAENGYTLDDIAACLEENDELFRADAIMKKYLEEKSRRGC